MKNKSEIINLGCRLNIYEGEIIKNHVNKKNLKNTTIINSCSVTHEAEKKVDYEIRRAKKKFPKNKIIVTGCAAQINPSKYELNENVDYVIGNKEKLIEKTWLKLNNKNKILVSDILKETTTVPSVIEKFEGKFRAYVEIQQGCDHRCTFCIIPYGRGNNRSVPAGEIIYKINKLVKNGYKEVVLTGVDITDYGKDLPGKPSLASLIKRILKYSPELLQLRLSSIDCAEITEDFWPLLKEKRIMPHFHISLQSGNNLILKRMKRRHTREQAINFCNKILSSRPESTFGADIIAGFPTETEEMFEDSFNLIDKCNLTHLHVFPFSVRQNTPASKMPQVNKFLIKKRAKILRDKSQEKLKEHIIKKIGEKNFILIEKSDSNGSTGKDQNFLKVRMDKKYQEGSIIPCIYTGINNNILIAKKL